jgi:succinate dehydrogenase hydrophobic anchor subunit
MRYVLASENHAIIFMHAHILNVTLHAAIKMTQILQDYNEASSSVIINIYIPSSNLFFCGYEVIITMV